MKQMEHMREHTERQLGRKLQEKELAFLRWVYDRYQEERQRHINI
ncbi:hypothetical protein GCM10008983_10840 [Lentibacillus halophilus]|uniref:Fur-regulated basic protein B n=1 Tax=Lentibacillus halophilus TaxID=295065 RepID=A0ABP3J0H4_9BACI